MTTTFNPPLDLDGILSDFETLRTDDDCTDEQYRNAVHSIPALVERLRQADRIAVALEQENAELARHIAVQAAGHERYRDVVRGCTSCKGGE